MSKPLLSIGMIVKDEIRCIEKCLKALQPLRDAIPCQLVIADTGSTDGTREIAEQYADVLIDFPWVNDFAAARNAVLEQCTGKWYLTVDADEYLDPEFSQLTDFLTGPGADQCKRAAINQYSYHDMEMKGDAMDFLAVRMARMEPGLHYEGAIHEVLISPTPTGKIMALPDVKFHHDGYALDPKDPKRGERKAKRNLKLLDKELEKHPHDLRRLLQCIESSGPFPSKAMDYARRAMKEVERQKNEYAGKIWGATICRASLNTAVTLKMDELEEWRKWSMETFPDSIFLRTDGHFALARWYLDRKEYERTAAEVLAYLTGWQDYQDRKYDLSEITHSAVHHVGRKDEGSARAAGLEALGRLGRSGEAADLFAGEPDWITLKPAEVRKLLAAATWSADDERMQEAVAQAAQTLKGMDEDENWNMFRSIAAQTFRDKIPGPDVPKYPWRLFRQVEGTLGIAARMMDAEGEGELAALLAQVDEWKDLPATALSRALEARLPMPASLFRRSAESLSGMAAVLAGDGVRFARTAADWLIHQPPAQTPGELTWQLDLVAAALRTSGWEEDENLGQTLCALFIDLSATYLENIYNPELLNGDDLPVLPGLHRFGWRLWKAQEALDNGDELGYVRTLRAALDTAPAMKKAVEFLTRHPVRPQPSPELLALAEQVKAILAQYSPDDPAVIQLKASPAYQRVASLLEQQGSHEPAHETKPLDTLAEPSKRGVEEALSGTREEIRDELRRHFQAVGGLGEQRAAYWAKYPLWGATPEEVFDNLSAALTEHREDFLWLYDRLGDGLSRRVLSAVLRNWRFCETGPLRDVEDPCYDDYFDLGLLRCGENEVVADMGAFVGDTFLSYIQNYGADCYKRYYAYEITPDSFAKLKAACAPYPRVVCRRKGVGAGPGTMALDSSETDASANTLSQKGSDTVEIVALDDDIREPITLLKMDVEGAEQSALTGCLRHIREDRPKLALSVYHNFEDIWKLARMAEDAAPGVYRFYLRYHGGNLWPSEISLLGIPRE